MLEITKGGKTFTVPKKAYHEMYEPYGWHIKSSKAAPIETDNHQENPKADLERLNTLEELKKFADKYGINIDGLTSRKAAKNAILQALSDP